MSAQTAGPETLGHLSEEPPPVDPNSKKAKSITGKLAQSDPALLDRADATREN